jgi:hypothetical protein
MQRYPIRPALLLALIALLMLASAAPLYAAGESLARAAVLSGGGDATSGGGLRSAVGEPIVGLTSAGGATLCSGFLCAPALEPAACTPVTGVTINGPATGGVGVALNYTAVVAPSAATGPILYTWSPAPGSGQNSAAASFTFTITGTQTISVTTTNCGGSGIAEDDHTVTITESGNGPLYVPALNVGP